MKTLGFAAGLLLLITVSYCTAMPRAVNAVAPVMCCFNFFRGRIPQRQIISIIKTDSRCVEKGFVVSTARGTQICVCQNLNWAQEAYKQQHDIWKIDG
ncbi:C-C motif chemokine 3-like [Dicentrarchus labrax]|uniref:C-C motif chemokine 3-like n=1 Tax=Dicentrarchus labrax TaxID=13489 RepID=UPI0021F5BC2E|nr:C-C motif chemokine 3-like [Dicentrarchus labrax]